MRFGSKVPGTAMEIRDVNMDFAYGGSFTEASPEAYERLILDVLLGDPPLFPRHEEVELSWKILDPILEHWAAQGQARSSYPSGTLGPGVGRRDAGPRRPGLDGDPCRGLMIELTDTNSAGDRRRVRPGPDPGRQPGDGHGDDAGRSSSTRTTPPAAMEAAQAASHEHPARVLGVILGDGRGAGRDRRPGRHRPGLVRRDRADPARAARWSSTPSRWCCRCCCPTPPSPSGGRPTPPTTRPPTRSARSASAGSPTPRPSTRGKHQGDARPSARPTPPATPTWPGPGSPRGGRCSPRRSTSTRSRSRRRTVTAERISPSADLLVGLAARPAEGAASTRANSDGPGHHRGGAGDRARAPIRIARPDGGLATFTSPGQPDRPVALQAARRCPSCSPRSCGASTRTTCTPPPPRAPAEAASRERHVRTAPATVEVHDGRRDALADRRAPASCSTRLRRRPGRGGRCRRSR